MVGPALSVAKTVFRGARGALRIGGKTVKELGEETVAAGRLVQRGAQGVGATPAGRVIKTGATKVGRGASAVSRKANFQDKNAVMGAAIPFVAGGIYGVGSGIRGTMVDANKSLGNPASFAYDYSVRKSFDSRSNTNDLNAKGSLVTNSRKRSSTLNW